MIPKITRTQKISCKRLTSESVADNEDEKSTVSDSKMNDKLAESLHLIRKSNINLKSKSIIKAKNAKREKIKQKNIKRNVTFSQLNSKSHEENVTESNIQNDDFSNTQDNSFEAEEEKKECENKKMDKPQNNLKPKNLKRKNNSSISDSEHSSTNEISPLKKKDRNNSKAITKKKRVDEITHRVKKKLIIPNVSNAQEEQESISLKNHLKENNNSENSVNELISTDFNTEVEQNINKLNSKSSPNNKFNRPEADGIRDETSNFDSEFSQIEDDWSHKSKIKRKSKLNSKKDQNLNKLQSDKQSIVAVQTTRIRSQTLSSGSEQKTNEQNQKIQKHCKKTDYDSIKLASEVSESDESEVIGKNVLQYKQHGNKSTLLMESPNEVTNTLKSTIKKKSKKLKSNLTEETSNKIVHTFKVDIHNTGSDPESEKKARNTLSSSFQETSQPTEIDGDENVQLQSICNKSRKKNLCRKNSLTSSPTIKCELASSESDSIDVVNTKTSISDHESGKISSWNHDTKEIMLGIKPEVVLEESFNSEYSKFGIEKLDNNLIIESQKNSLTNKLDSNCKSSKTRRKLRNSESDQTLLDVTNTDVTDSMYKKIYETNDKDKVSQKSSDDESDVNVNKFEGDIKSEKKKLSALDSFFRRHKDEDKHFEFSNSSDCNIKLEEEEEDEEYRDMEEIDFDEEDDNVEIGMMMINRTSYYPTEEEVLFLKSLYINLRHIVPPQHLIETKSGTRNLTRHEKKEFQKHSTLRVGSFTENEDQILRKNWIIFCKSHNWDPTNPKPFLQMKYKNKDFFLKQKEERMKFVRFLADGLFDRSLYSVYNRFKVIYDPHKVTRYKPDEDFIILDFMRKKADRSDDIVIKKDRKFADLALMLRRTRASVWRRYQVLQKKEKNLNHVDIDNL